MIDHYQYKKLTKCSCILCVKCRSTCVRNPKTEKDIIESKKWKLRRILFSELSYLLRDRKDELEIIFLKLIEENKWDDDWYKKSMEEIYFQLKGPS